jgi:hypothetical protein
MAKPCEPFTGETKKKMLKRLVRLFIWWMVISVMNHLFFITALQKNHGAMRELGLWALAGIFFNASIELIKIICCLRLQELVLVKANTLC